MRVFGFVNRYDKTLQSLNCDGNYGRVLAALCLLLLLPAAGGEPWRLALRYERAGLLQGEWWRWLTGHFVHLDLQHALLNATGLVLLWALFARELTFRRWLLVACVSLLGIDLGFWLLQPTLQWYVGASGLLHGLMAAGAIAMLRRGDRLGWAVVIPFVAKICWEQLHGPLPFETGAVVVVSAHLYGAAGGALIALLLPGAARTAARREPL